MAKRFTDTDKWNKPWYRKLKSKYKCVWQYFLDKCDHAGFIKIDAEIISSDLYEKFTQQELLDIFSSKLVKIKDELYWIPKFIDFQYNKIQLISGKKTLEEREAGENKRRNAQVSIVELLMKNGITWHFNESNIFTYNINNIIAPIKPLDSPLIGAKDMDKDKDKDNTVIQLDHNAARDKQQKIEKAILDLYLEHYPRKEGKTAGLKSLLKQIKTRQDMLYLDAAVHHFKKIHAETEKKYIKMFSTFANNWQDYLTDYDKKNIDDFLESENAENISK